MTRTFRAIALVLLAPLVLAACAETEDVVDQVQDVADDVASELPGSDTGGQQGDTTGDGQDGQRPGDPGGEDAGGQQDGQADGQGDGQDGGQSTPRVEADDLGRVGANGKPYLGAGYARLIMEVDVQEGAEPDGAALDHLVATLRGVADKPDGIVFAGGNTFSSDRTEWTATDLRAAAEQHRSNFSSGDTAVLYLLYVDGTFHAGGQESSAIGVTHNASEVGVFPNRWRAGLGTLLGSNRSIERAVLVHELGHALGLVNLTYTSDIDHEDPEHPGHSSSRGSVMYWAIESTAIGQVFSGPPPDAFDDDDRADLEGLKSGRY